MRSKLLTYIILLISISIRCMASPIDTQEAAERAKAFMHSRGLHPSTVSVKPVMAPGSNTPSFFIADTGYGYVIVGGAESSGEILGYTDRSDYDQQLIPPSAMTFLESCGSNTNAPQPSARKTPLRNKGPRKAVSPIITSNWDQGITTATGDAYNMLCPTIDEKHTLSGCVAVAMAQVMRHHRWPATRCKGIKPYNAGSNVGLLDSLPPVQFDWDNMMDCYIGEETDEEQMAVATLMQYCGQATLTKYSLSSSDAYGTEATKALRDIFGYAPTLRYIKRSDYNGEKWDDMLHEELQAGRPVIYFGTNSEHGHCFICDGCDNDGFYHINWGWGGRYDGYFKLNALRPENAASGYNINQQAIIGIIPTDQAPQAIAFADSTAKAICVANWDTNSDGELSCMEASKVASLAQAFKGNASIRTFEELKYFSGLQTIEDEAFENCTSLQSVELPAGITSIGTHAFMGCTKLKAILIPYTVNDIGIGAFASCNSMNNMSVSADNPIYDSRDGCNAIIETSSNRIVAGCSQTVIPSSARAIGEEAFSKCLTLTTLTLPQSIASIETHAFAGCTNLRNIYGLRTNPPATQSGAFEGCPATVYVPQNAKNLYEENEEWGKLYIIDLSSNTLSCQPVTFLRKKGATLAVELNNNEDIIGLQFYLKLPQGLKVKTDSLQKWQIEKTERSEDLTLHCTQQSDGTYIVMLMSMTLNVIDGNEGSVLNIPIEADENIEAGTHDVVFSEITLTLLGDNNMISGIYPPTFSTNITIKDFETGDVNHDHAINVTDVMMTVNHILGNNLAKFHAEDSDIDSNSRIDVTDVMLIVQMILDQEIQTPNQNNHATGPVFVRRMPLHNDITLDAPSRYNALQMTVALPESGSQPEIELCGTNAYTHAIATQRRNDGRWNVVVYSLGGKPFDAQSPTILTISSPYPQETIMTSNIILTTTSYETEEMSGRTTDGMEEAATPNDEDTPPTYNLSGQRVDRSYKGIVVRNGKKYMNVECGNRK